MADNNTNTLTDLNIAQATSSTVGEPVRSINSDLSTVISSSNSGTGSTRTYSPPLMGTSARAAKRRIDSDSGPIRIEGTDTYNQQLQHFYQNVRNVSEEQQQTELQNPSMDTSQHFRQAFNAKRDFFEQRFKTPPPTYDSPPRQQPAQKIVTTITTTTTASSPSTSNINDRTSSSSNESPSVDRVLEQAVELQKMSNTTSSKTEPQTPLIIERTEEYQVFLDSSNHEVRRTPSVSRTSIIPVAKSAHATDLDQAQAQVQRLTDDHQAIQHLTRVLQQHNTVTNNEQKPLGSQATPNLPSLPPQAPEILVDRTNLPTEDGFSVIDALIYNPIGTNNGKSNSLSSTRYRDIVTNLRNPEYVTLLQQSVASSKEAKKKTKEKKPKEKKPKDKKSKKTAKLTADNAEHTATTTNVNTNESVPTQITESIVATNLSEQAPLIDPKEKKKQDKENKKASKAKSKQKSKNENYQVVDAIIGSPISLRLPDSYRTKYNVSPPLSHLEPLQSTSSPITSNTNTSTTAIKSKKPDASASDKNQTLYNLVKIVQELQVHHTAALKASYDATAPNKNATNGSKDILIPSKQSTAAVNEVVQQQPLLERQHPMNSTNQTSMDFKAESGKPRVVYRYMDEQGRVLIVSPVPPSQLREESVQQYPYRETEITRSSGRQVTNGDDDRRRVLSPIEQRATWQGELTLPTTMTRIQLESQDKRVPQLRDKYIPNTRTIPVSGEQGLASGDPQQQQIPSNPNSQNVRLAWLPLSYQGEPTVAGGTTGYDTDSTISERSATQRTYDYGPSENSYRYSNRPVYNDYYYNRSPGPFSYRNLPSGPYSGRNISPEYGEAPRNYIEVFRGGDFRETKPSEIYSLPLSEHMRTSQNLPSGNRPSRYDQYQSERYNAMMNRNYTPLSQRSYYSYTLPHSRYQENIPPSTVHASSYYTHRSPYHHRTVQSSPNPDGRISIRHSKSFDYRPLRAKLQREYKITPNLLVDEWDYPQISDNTKYSTTSATNQNGVSSTN